MMMMLINKSSFYIIFLINYFYLLETMAVNVYLSTHRMQKSNYKHGGL
jgi:hypothetical protein